MCKSCLSTNEYTDTSVIRKLLRRRTRKIENVGINTLALMTILPVYKSGSVHLFSGGEKVKIDSFLRKLKNILNFPNSINLYS